VRLPTRRYALLAALALAAVPARAALYVAAGDIGECGAEVSASAALATARLIPAGAHVLMLGDSAYRFADRATLERCYTPTWGAFREHTLAVPGNHDYVGGSAEDFRAYFGLPSRERLYFRVREGEWWFIGLDSNLRDAPLAAEEAWLAGELAAIHGDGRCLLAFWHHPVVSTGLHQGSGAHMRGIWRALDAEGADLALAGHEHFYEAFAPLDGELRKGRGIREFVVGTGGARLKDVTLAPWRHRAFALVHGVLELELEPGRYGWRFVTTSGEELDRGEDRCRRSVQSR
jgi:acid phosphatase type 7